MNGKHRMSRHAGLALLACALIESAPVAAQSVEDFYKSNTLTILLGHPPGGSYDLYARLAANHIRKYIPGNPNIIVQHRPGGGGVGAVGFFYAQAPRNGAMLGLFPETIVHTQLLQPDIGKWNVGEMAYVGSFAGVNAVFVVRKGAPATNVEDMRRTSVNVGCTGRNSQSYQSPAMLKNLGGFKFNIICGYPGSAESVFALTKGEVDVVSSAWNAWRATHPDEIKAGTFIPVIQVGLRRAKELPNVPLMQELVDNERNKALITFASAGSAIGRALIAPPQVPADRLAVLRQAFDKLVQDPDFIHEADRARAELDPLPGAEVQKVVATILAALKGLIDESSKAME